MNWIIRLARELTRTSLQLTLLPLACVSGVGAMAALFLGPVHFFKYGGSTGGQWDTFTLFTLAGWSGERCDYNGSDFSAWLASVHTCRIETTEPWLRGLFFSDDSKIAGLVEVADAIFDLNSLLACLLVASLYWAIDAYLPSQY